MKVLVVGGSGLIGGHAALHLAALGHQVTIGARNRPDDKGPFGSFPFMAVDYLDDSVGVSHLEVFEGLVFAAAHDIRHTSTTAESSDDLRYWRRVNSQGVPRFFSHAKKAGIRRAVYVGSYYPQVAPYLASVSAYVQSRAETDDGVRALAGGAFEVCSVNPSSVTGSVGNIVPAHLRARAAYASSKLLRSEPFAIPGGTNFISSRSVAEAITGALENGESGKAYLVGDENLTYRQYLELFFAAAGGRRDLPIWDNPHPLFPSASNYAGKGKTLFFTPEVREQALLGYGRHDVRRAIEEIVHQCVCADGD